MTAKRSNVGLNLVLVIYVLLSVYPIVFMLTNAFKDGLQTAVNPFAVTFAKPFGENFAMAWQAIAPDFVRSRSIV